MTERRAPRQVARAIGIALAVGFVALLAYGLTTRSNDRTIDDALAGGKAVAAPGFDLAVLERGGPDLPERWRAAAADGRVDLRELRGVPVVLNFWASWCDPCRAEAPVLERGWRSAQPRGALFLGLDMQDLTDDARAFARRFGLAFPHVRDPSRDTARAWGVTGIPETFFIDRDGRVVGHVIGSVTDAQLREGVDAALAGRPRGTDQGGARRPAR